MTFSDPYKPRTFSPSPSHRLLFCCLQTLLLPLLSLALLYFKFKRALSRTLWKLQLKSLLINFLLLRVALRNSQNKHTQNFLLFFQHKFFLIIKIWVKQSKTKQLHFLHLLEVTYVPHSHGLHANGYCRDIQLSIFRTDLNLCVWRQRCPIQYFLY